MAGPKVSIIKRFHCTSVCPNPTAFHDAEWVSVA